MTNNSIETNRFMRKLGFPDNDMSHNVAKLRAYVAECLAKGIPVKLSGAYCPDNINNNERAWRLLQIAS